MNLSQQRRVVTPRLVRFGALGPVFGHPPPCSIHLPTHSKSVTTAYKQRSSTCDRNNAYNKQQAFIAMSIWWKRGMSSKQLCDGCSKKKRTPREASTMHSTMTRLAKSVPSATNSRSWFPSGINDDLPLVALLLNCLHNHTCSKLRMPWVMMLIYLNEGHNREGSTAECEYADAAAANTTCKVERQPESNWT